MPFRDDTMRFTSSYGFWYFSSMEMRSSAAERRSRPLLLRLLLLEQRGWLEDARHGELLPPRRLHDGTLVTRPNGRDILPGCTAKAVMALAALDGVVVEERGFTVADALAAREAMSTSASAFVLPVVRMDGQAIGDGAPGPIARRLRRLYIEAARAG